MNANRLEFRVANLLLTLCSSTTLLLSLLSLSSIRGTSAGEQEISCTPHSYFIQNGDKTVLIHTSDLKVRFDRDQLAIYQYSTSDDGLVNVLVNRTVVVFSGVIANGNEALDNKTFYEIPSKLAGVAQLKSNKLLGDCNLYMSRNKRETDTLPAAIKIEILHQAALCMKTQFCRKIGAVNSSEIKTSNEKPFDFGPTPVMTRKKSNPIDLDWDDIKTEVARVISAIKEEGDHYVTKDILQSAINKLLDLAIAELVRKMKEDNEGYIEIPEIKNNFTTGSSFWQTNGEFSAEQGTFGDLTSLIRTKDAVVSHDRLKFIASCGLGLTKAKMEYKQYRLKYGIVNVNGKVSASVNGAEMAAQIAVDYNHEPCKTVLQELHVSDVGKIKVSLTGLGPLNKLVSKLASWITQKWKEEIIVKVEEQLKEIMAQHLDNFNCERFRP